MGPPTVNLPLIAILANSVLVIWRVRARMRRFIGRQRFRPLHSWASIGFFTILVIALLIGSFRHPSHRVAELLGVGIGLAAHGLRLTKFEPSPGGLYYTPNVHIGIALSLLLVARVVYRSLESYFSTAGFTEPPTSFVRSPLTLLIVGTLAGYYAWYAFGLLLRYREGQGARPTQGSGDA